MTDNNTTSGNPMWKIFRNKLGYTDEEVGELKKVRWVDNMSGAFAFPYWIKVEMVKTNRCSAGWKQGDKLYFSNVGMLISRKAPRIVCPHAIAALSPAFYSCMDRLSRGADPRDVMIDHVSCTDPGFDNKGLGNNTMRVTFEKIPFYQRLIDTLTTLPYFFYQSSKARGPNPGGLPKADKSDAQPDPEKSKDKQYKDETNFLQNFSLSEKDRDLFIESEKRMKRALCIEKYKNAIITIEVVKSVACIAGHGIGEKIYFDSMGRMLTENTNKPICSRLLNKIWYRLIMILDRLADDSADALGDGTFTGELPGVMMSCYGAELPYGDCGQILMSVSIQTNNK